MPRVTKALAAKAKHKKVLKRLKVTMVQEVGYLRLLSNLILKPCNMLLEIEGIKKEPSVLCGFQESQQP